MTAGDPGPSAGVPPPIPPPPIGGWLIVVAIGVVLVPIGLVAIMVRTFVPLFTNGSWEELTTPGTENYHPLWCPLLIFELLVNIGFTVAYVWLIFLFFKRSRAFPKVFIWLAALAPISILVDSLLCSLVLPEVQVLDPGTRTELARSMGSVVIWIPYLLLSRRVKRTFVA